VRTLKLGDTSSSAPKLFLGAFFPALSSFGAFFYFFESNFSAGSALLIAGTLAGLARRKLLVKRADRQMYVLLAPELRQRVFDLAGRAKVKLTELFVLPDNGDHVVNAFAFSNRTIRVSERLLRRLSRKEVDAVVAHELGHLKRGHALPRQVSLSGSLIVGLCLSLFFRGVGSPPQHLNLLFPASLAVGIALTFFVARRLEYSADWWSVRIAADPEAMITGLVRITRDGQLPLNWSKWDEKLLSHPSTVRRAARIAKKSGITAERLGELLNPHAEPDECYSLAAGQSVDPTVANTVSPGAACATPKIVKNRTWYGRLPFANGLAAFLAWAGLTSLGLEFLSPNLEPIVAAAWVYWLGSSVMLGITVCVLTARYHKRKLLRNVTTPFTFAKASADQFLGLDVKAVTACTAELESLGFEATEDYCIDVPGAPEKLKHFLRVSVRPEKDCWALVSQVVTDTLGVSKVSGSFATDLGNGFAFYTSNVAPSAALYAARMPREIRVHVPGASLTDLLGSHLARRQSIAAATGLVPLEVTAGNDYLAYELERAADRRRVVKRRNSWLFLRRVDRFSRKPMMEWAGRDKRIKKSLSVQARPSASEVQRA
jgi:Zn-dependent protease with chaperone function